MFINDDQKMDTYKENRNKIVKREVSTKKNHLISLFNNFEVTILDKKKKYFDKFQLLLSAWEHISIFVSESSTESPQPEFDSLFLHTFRLILRADWRNVNKPTKTHLSLILQRIISDVTNAKRYSSILPQCRVLESVINNDPWSHTVLKKIIQDEEPDEDELIEYFHLENGKVIVVRLEILLESKCEDIASRLSKACLMTYYNADHLELDLNSDEVDYITDIYLCTLYRTKNTRDLIAELKMLDLSDGLDLLRRYNKHGGVAVGFNENCKEARIWKCSRKVIELISNTLLANAVLKDNLDSSDVVNLEELIREWAVVHTTNSTDVFTPIPLETIWKCVLIARCSMCIYPFCNFLIDRGGKKYDLNLVLRCLIRAINQNMNEIEQHRVNRYHDKLKFTHDLLSKGFLLTADLFCEYRNIFRECLLTAFSLMPSHECLLKLEDFVNNINSVAKDSVDEINKIDTEIKNDNCNPDYQNTNDVAAADASANDVKSLVKNDLNVILESMGIDKSDECAEIKPESEVNSHSWSETIKGNAPAYVTELDTVKIDDGIKMDLNAILGYQRHYTLTWDYEWSDLKANCEKYREIFEERGFDEVELKYLELDYNQFKNRPVHYDEFAGIEKGYEHFIVSEEESENELPRQKTYCSSSDSDYDDDYGRRKRKKSRCSDDEWRRKMKKKRPKPKSKLESNGTIDEASVDSLLNENSLDGEISMKKNDEQLHNYSNNLDGNTDSPSETQPSGEVILATVDDPESCDTVGAENTSNNLQVLRQFRINLSKSLTPEENTSPLEAADDAEKTTDRVFSDGEHMQLKICITKCDSLSFNGDFKSYDRKESEDFKKPDNEAPSISGHLVRRKLLAKARARRRSKCDNFMQLRKQWFSLGSMNSKETAEEINDLIDEMFPEFTTNDSWKTNAEFVENSSHLEDVTKEASSFQPPLLPTLSEFSDTTLDSTLGPSSLNEATFVSSSIEPSVLATSTPSLPATESSQRRLVPQSSSTSSSDAKVLFSYLNSSIDSTDIEYSYSSNMCQNHSVPQASTYDTISHSTESTSELLDISTSNQNSLSRTLSQSAYSDDYTTYQPSSDPYSVNESSAYSTSVISADTTITTTSSSMTSNGLQTDAHSKKSRKSTSKLRAALQKPTMNCTVNLYNIAHTMKQSSKGGDVNAVSQILDVYRDTLVKHPELEHVPAPRVRSSNSNASKRQRRSKKETPLIPSQQPESPRTSYLSQISPVNSGTNNDYMPSPPPNHQMQVPVCGNASMPAGVQVPGQLNRAASNQPLRRSTNQTNLYTTLSSSTISSSPQKLPGCPSTDISSQNYGDDGRKNEEVSSAYDTNSSQLVNMNGYANPPTNTYYQNNVQPNLMQSNGNWTNTVVQNGSNMMEMDERSVNTHPNTYADDMQMNVDNNCDDIKLPLLLATIYNDSTEIDNSSVCISIPEDQYSEAYFRNCFPAVEGGQSSSELYSKNENVSAPVNVQNLLYTDDRNVIKHENTTFDNGVMMNMDSLFYQNSNYSTEMNKYGA